MVFASRRGWFVVMRWARPMTHSEWEDFKPGCIAFAMKYYPALPIEVGKHNSYGVYRGSVVAVDYGTPS